MGALPVLSWKFMLLMITQVPMLGQSILQRPGSAEPAPAFPFLKYLPRHVQTHTSMALRSPECHDDFRTQISNGQEQVPHPGSKANAVLSELFRWQLMFLVKLMLLHNDLSTQKDCAACIMCRMQNVLCVCSLFCWGYVLCAQAYLCTVSILRYSL